MPELLDLSEPNNIGQIHATETYFDGVGCRSKDLDYYGGLVLNGQGSVLEMDATFAITNALTVELWFRFPNIEIDGPYIPTTSESIYLYSMSGNGGASEDMSVYIDAFD